MCKIPHSPFQLIPNAWIVEARDWANIDVMFNINHQSIIIKCIFFLWLVFVFVLWFKMN